MTETLEQMIIRHDKETQDILKSTDEGESNKNAPAKSEELGNVKPDVDNNEEWKKGYTEYEIKTKQSDSIAYDESEIEIIEENM